MTPSEAYQHVVVTRPNLLYVAGKTSTGKSTFSNKLREREGYALVELDRVFVNEVLSQFNALDRDAAFVEAYKLRRHEKLIATFVAVAKREIAKQLATGKPVVVEGAIANAETLFDLFGDYPDLLMLYFHPVNLDVYIGYLTKRLHAEFGNTTGAAIGMLPVNFWKRMGDDLRAQFKSTHTVTPPMEAAIRAYAVESQTTSPERMTAFRARFPQLIVVTV